MENNDSNKSQQTGGLKLMTVFIAVLALHVAVIGGIIVYRLMSGGSEEDMAITDKNHKDLKSSDASVMADGSLSIPSDKTTAASTASTDSATPAPPTSTADQVTTVDPTVATPATTPIPSATKTAAPATTPAPATAPGMAPAAVPPTSVASTPILGPIAPITMPTLTLSPSKPSTLAPPADVVPGVSTPSGPITQPSFGPIASTPPVSAGPVHFPPAEKSPDAPKIAREKIAREKATRTHHELYTVKITDSYRKIAKAHHVTVAQLKEANHIKGDTLHTGQKLIIPSAGSIVATTISSNGDAPTATRAVLKTNSPETASLAAEPAPSASTRHHHVYTIQKGDTLVKIAHKFKTTPVAIMEANDIPDPAKLTIGKKLHIPSHETRETSATRTAPAEPSQARATVPPAPAPVQATSNPANFSGEMTSFVP